MRLIHTRTLKLEEHFGDNTPKYAILSHTWDDGEVNYQEWQQSTRWSLRKGLRKIRAACDAARQLSLDYLWVDTNCINKDSSTELSEAINSMFTWYQRSTVCLVYLQDFNYSAGGLENLASCRYWTPGWTLQELLAPSNMLFFDSAWYPFGTKDSLMLKISKITSIHMQYLAHPDSVHMASVARRMSWVAQRSTTRIEDKAYCLMGIFEVNMPLLYGEGEKAFIRLQEEIIKHSNDQSIFCWSGLSLTEPAANSTWSGCLAPRPIAFLNSGNYLTSSIIGKNVSLDYQLTNNGLRIDLPLLKGVLGGYRLGMLSVTSPGRENCSLGVCLRESRGGNLARLGELFDLLNVPKAWTMQNSNIYLAHERDPGRKAPDILSTGMKQSFHKQQQYGILPLYSSAIDDHITPLETYDWGLPWTDVPETNGPIVALRKQDSIDKWYALMFMQSPKFRKVKIELEVHIRSSLDGPWDVTVHIQGESETDVPRTTRQELSLPSAIEFTMGKIEPHTRVRPVLISFQDFFKVDDPA